jgi:methionine-S-sulfoxide reductase
LNAEQESLVVIPIKRTIFNYMRILIAITLLLISNMTHSKDGNIKTALYAGGCFWCLEQGMKATEGVVDAISGYTGGTKQTATYEQVSTGKTKHFEAVMVKYDASIISYEKLTDAFFRNIDPTDPKGQFADKGSQYQTAVFYSIEAEKQIAEHVKKDIAYELDIEVATKILPATEFYPAESYHQDYSKKNPIRYNAYKYGSGRVDKLKKLYNK